ncbi:MAG: TIGR00730 family Rossman fold protein [Bacteroidota bacterium]
MDEITMNGGLNQNAPKRWNENITGENSWTMFKVVSEFVEAFEVMNQLGPCVSIFGSARTKPSHPFYQQAQEIARKLTEEGYGVITGGGPGIMEAANKGAHQNGCASIGLNIDLPFEQSSNPFVDYDKDINFRYFFIRKVIFVKYAQAFIACPGGFGTLDELFEVLTLIQTKKISPVPVILVGTEFWGGMREWIKTVMLERESNISPHDMDLIPVVDSTEEVLQIIREFYQGEGHHLAPNYKL